MSKNLSEGYTCGCGKFNGFGVYVYAHWDVRLDHTCECGAKNTVLRGEVVRNGRRKAKKKSCRV